MIIATNHSEFDDLLARLPARRPARGPLERHRQRRRVRPRAGQPIADMSRVLVTGGAGTIGAALVRRLVRDPDWEVRVSDQRAAPEWMRESCEVHTGDLRDPAEARARRERLHARDPPGRDRRRDRQLPQAAAHAARGEQRALQRACSGRALDARVERLVYVSSSMVFERATEFPTTEEHLATARRRARRTASRSSRARSTAAPLHDEHGLPYTICRPFNAYGPGEMPDAEPGIAHAVPDLIRKVLSGPAAAPDLRLAASRRAR